MLEPTASWTLIALGAALVCAALYGAFRLGRHVTDMAGLQLRQHARDMAAAAKATERQIGRIRDVLLALQKDSRTTPVMRELQRALELTEERKPP